MRLDLGQGRIHLLGICGTAMASLAGLLRERGFSVTGSDQNVYPPMSDLLARLGIPVRSPYSPENLPSEVDLVVVGNAISRGNPELEAVLDRGLSYASMPELMKGLFLRGRASVVVAGTHGKTTTTALIAWLLEQAGQGPGFLVGGIPINFGSSFRLGSGEPFVIEGDEYDTAYFDKGPKFLHYLPQIVVLGNIEYDHADIYPDLDSVITAFRRLVQLIPRRGLLLVGAESPHALAVAREAPCRVASFAVDGDATWQARGIETDSAATAFEVWRSGERFGRFRAPLWGKFSVRNALAALAVGEALAVEAPVLERGLAAFLGVRRRLEVCGEPRGIVVVDDFAHHPTAIRETLSAARTRWPGRRIWAVFEPRSFTVRTRIFQRELPDALAGADRVVLAPVFRTHRIPPEQELSEEELVGELTGRGRSARFLPSVGEIVDLLAAELSPGDVVLAMSNGGFDGLHARLVERLG
jgi:UDP-N-acetylmuramate: L-alanyl-gamma-D-glutamyl-meso-diaminopimelate ligase